METNLGNVLRT